jgi:glyoxylase-like metal-dependent hydrolase (beta-lactamase superfamily II)
MQTRLTVLDLGRLEMDSRVLIGSGPRPFSERVAVPISAYCIDHPDGRVLFDTGCHPDAMGPNGRWSEEFQRDYTYRGGKECMLPHRLEQIGLGPNDFRHVVLSHLHSDHAGCTEFFRKSRIIVHANEFAAAQGAYRRHEDDDYVWQDTDAWMKADLDWRPVQDSEGDLDINSNVRLLNLGRGHAHGMLALSVALPETGRIVLASDALYCAENLGGQLPGWLLDRAGYLGAVQRLRALSRDAQVWFGHDPRQFATLRCSTEGWYE